MDLIESEIDNIIKSTTQNIDLYNNNVKSDMNDNVNHDVNDDMNNNVNDDMNNNVNDDVSNDNMNDDVNKSSEINNSVIDSDNIEVFNIALHQYLKINEEIKALLDAIKIRNKTKKQLADTIGTYLQANEIRNVNLGGSYKGKKIETKVTYQSKGFSKVNVTKAIYNELKEEADIFDKIMESISKTNIISEKWNIKIVNDKQISAKSKTDVAKQKIDMAEQLLNDEDD